MIPNVYLKKKNDEKFQNLTQLLLLTSLSLAILPFTPKDFKLETAPLKINRRVAPYTLKCNFEVTTHDAAGNKNKKKQLVSS